MALSALGEKSGARDVRSPAASAAFLRDRQWDEGRGCLPAHPDFGGTGRRQDSLPDLSHTALLLQAMRAAGVAAGDPYIRKASVFIARCQVTGEPGATGDGDRGGFLARPVVVAGGATRMRTVHPTGAATCLGLTSLLAAGATRDDPRVRDAVRWLEGHYTLDAHPGMAHAREGLYGYYYEFARTMTALRRDRIRDARGVVHDWRAELGRTLADRQHPDGSWTNPEESRDPSECAPSTITSLALLTLRQLGP
jgi:squalene-hopene/tetraprenyl-beta-curcumene cyclase